MSTLFTAKRNSFKLRTGAGLPLGIATGGKYVGVFTGRAIEIEDPESVQDMHMNGCFGVSSLTKSTPRCMLQKETSAGRVEKLLLFPEEAFFLSYSLKSLEIRNKEGAAMTNEQCLREFVRIHPNFISSFVVYSYLRSKNWVLKSGLKFGGDFLAYRRGPEDFHASYLVLVQPENSSMDPVKLQCIHRVSQTSGKEVLLMEVTPQPGDYYSEYLKNRFSNFEVVKSIPKRFILK